MPAGNYAVTWVEEGLLLIEGGPTHSAYLPFMPIQAETPHSQTEVTFNRYRKIDFLDQVWVQGEKHGMQMLTGTAEQEAVKHETEKYRHALPGLLRK